MLPDSRTVAVWIGPAVGDGSSCSDAEHDRAARHHDARAATRWLAGRALLRRVIAEATGSRPADVVLDEEPGGKPFASETDLHINLSHAGELVAIAIAGAEVGPVGIDIERPRHLHRPDRLAARLMPDDCERCNWASTPEPQRTMALLQRWTRTEALLKATGDGIHGGITGAERRLIGEGWTVQDLVIADGGVGAVAARGATWAVLRHDLG